MNIVQCQFCRKPFTSIGGRICPDCMQQLDLDFITVRDYIDEHHHANIKIISDETDVPEKHIIHLIKEGRLVLDSPSGDGGFIACEVCHKPISTGRMCESCKKALSSTIDKTTSSSSSAGAPKDEKSKQAIQDLKKLGKIR